MIEIRPRETQLQLLPAHELQIGVESSTALFSKRFRSWLQSNRAPLTRLRDRPDTSFEERVEQILRLQAILYDTGWARYGWPTHVGGLGGSALLRAAFVEVLADSGYPPRNILEHLEIIAPSLVRFGTPEFVATVLPGTLRADIRWCQGFSEPTAGSDLAALRTRAEKVSGGYRIRGHKIWTSWAKWATHATVLARTGAPEERHRVLTMFAVPLDTPGVTVNVIRQSNDTDEFAEVFMDDAIVSDDHVIGEVNGGWSVAMYLLSCERGAFAWQRHLGLAPRLAAMADMQVDPGCFRSVGEAATDLFSVRARAWTTMRELAAGGAPGPEAAVNKILITDAEQQVLDAVAEGIDASLALGVDKGGARWQEEYLFSRATSIYGGTRQIQLNVIASNVLRQAAGTAASLGDYSAYHDGILEALTKADNVRSALIELDWWASAGPDAVGEGRMAFGALFEVEGRMLALTPALGALLSQPILAAAHRDTGLAGGAAAHVDVVDGLLRLWLLPGALDAEWIALNLPGGRAAIVPSVHCLRANSRSFDRSWLINVEVDASRVEPIIVPTDAYARAVDEARVAVAFESLGACDAMLESAIRHAAERVQFGRPIAEFQAVQHILAEAHVARTGLREVCHLALHQLCAGSLDSELAGLTKIVAGRVGAKVSQNTLQVLGAIGFTEDHPQNAFMRRILTLDGILGSARSLSNDVGRRIIAEGRVPRGPAIENLPGARD